MGLEGSTITHSVLENPNAWTPLSTSMEPGPSSAGKSWSSDSSTGRGPPKRRKVDSESRRNHHLRKSELGNAIDKEVPAQSQDKRIGVHAHASDGETEMEVDEIDTD